MNKKKRKVGNLAQNKKKKDSLQEEQIDEQIGFLYVASFVGLKRKVR